MQGANWLSALLQDGVQFFGPGHAFIEEPRTEAVGLEVMSV